jgi:hypothetical protein
VVYTRDTSGLAKIYIDGVEQVSGAVGGNFSNWDEGFRLALANEPTGDRPWLGEFHLAAIYDRALSQAEVSQNFEAGPDGTGAGGRDLSGQNETATQPEQTGSTYIYLPLIFK